MSPGSVEERLARIEERLDNACGKLDEIAKRLENHFVTREEFEPVKRIAYGIAGSALLLLLGALVGMVVHSY